MKTTKELFELFRSKSEDGKKFEDKHVVQKTSDANGNGDDVFKGSKVKPVDRKKNRQGYNPGEDEKVYEAVSVTKKDYNWGKMITVHDGNNQSFPLHPKHQEAIRNLKPGASTKLKDETGQTVHAERSPSGSLVHLKGDSNRTISVAHKHFTEDLEESNFLKKIKRGLKGWESGLHDVESVRRANSTMNKKDLEKIASNTNVAKGSPAELQVKLAKRALRKNVIEDLEVEKDLDLTEDQIIDAITEMAEIEGIELTEEQFYDLYERVVRAADKTNRSVGKLRSIKNSTGTSDLEHHKKLSHQISSKQDEDREHNPKAKSKKAKNVRESFLEKYVKPSQVPAEEKIQEELSYLPKNQIDLVLGLYENVDAANKAKILDNLTDQEFVSELVDFAITYKDIE